MPTDDWRTIRNEGQENYEILGLGWMDNNRPREEGGDKNYSGFSQQEWTI